MARTDHPHEHEPFEHGHNEGRHPPHHGLESPLVSHEPSDVDVVAVGKWGIGLALGIIVSVFVVWFIFDRLATWEADRSPRPLPVFDAEQRPLPPEPRLQAQPRLDMREFRALEDSLLGAPEWTDREGVTARIPVDAAMNLMLQRGFQVRSQPVDAATAEQRTLPSDASSGRTYERRAK
jgi:hypothetical protein